MSVTQPTRIFSIHMLTVVYQFPIRLVLNGPASKEIEWHCKHYVGRGLMKRFENGEIYVRRPAHTSPALQQCDAKDHGNDN